MIFGNHLAPVPGKVGLVHVPFPAGLDCGHGAHSAEYVNHSVSVNGAGRSVHSPRASGPKELPVFGVA